MEAINTFFSAILNFLLQLLQLFITFIISVLTLILDFARSIVGIVS